MDEKHYTTSDCSWKVYACTRRNLLKLALIAFVSALWLFLRTARKPSRIIYPCQQAALTNIHIFHLTFLATIASSSKFHKLKQIAQPALVGILLTSSLLIGLEYSNLLVDTSKESADENIRIPLSLESHEAFVSDTTSDIFVVQNASGTEGNMDNAIAALIELMENQGVHFFRTSNQPEGLIASNDVVLLKVNCQWPERGGTNTDLVKSLIDVIVNHPDEFLGEIIIADNGQGRGSLNWNAANSFYHNQLMEELVALFPTHKVSTKLWDNIREYTVGDYNEGDFREGYVRSSEWNPDTELYISYPKWQTPFGTYLSFKQGIWENETGFNSERFKVINLPVLKSHHVYGVTGCIKHYMGLPQGHIVSEISSTIPHEHFSIALGGMGTLMAETRFPVLNILDNIWINANPIESGRISCGPSTYYRSASFTDIICASIDPVALDYYASKNILMPTAEYENHTEYSSLDPDYEPKASILFAESFHNYLYRSMNELEKAGFQVTMNQTEMNVYIDILPSITSSITDTTPTTSSTLDQPLSLILILVPISVIIVIIAVVAIRKRKLTTTAIS